VKGVHERRARHRPTNRGNNVADSTRNRTARRTNLVGLVQHNAVPLALKEVLLVDGLLVVGDVDARLLEAILANHLPLVCTVDDEYVELRMQEDGAPGLNHGQRNEQNGLANGIVDHGGRHLNCLAETHVVALETAEEANSIPLRALRLLGEHPVHALELVVKVLKSAPQGLEVIGHFLCVCHMLAWKGGDRHDSLHDINKKCQFFRTGIDCIGYTPYLLVLRVAYGHGCLGVTHAHVFNVKGTT